MSDTPTFKDRAVQTLALDIPVIRLRPRDKAALDTGWPALATTDLRTVCKWNSETPDANVGAVAKAELNGVWFFEIDSLDVIKRIETETGQTIPPTYRVRSRPERGHYYWRQTPESIALGNIAQSFVKHGDFSVRVHNEYVVGALSINPKSGEPYTVAEDSPIAQCPTWLIDWIKAQRVEKEKLVREPGVLIPHGSINGHLVSLIGKLIRENVPLEAAEIATVAWAHENCAPPIDEGKVLADTRSMYKRYPAGNPGAETVLFSSSQAESSQEVSIPVDENSEEAIPDFDPTVINGIYAKFVHLVTRGTTLAPQYAYVIAKTIVGLRMAGKVKFENLDVEPRFYTALIGATGSGKGEAWRRVEQILRPEGATFNRLRHRERPNPSGPFAQIARVEPGQTAKNVLRRQPST
jgi:hypothetical protein